MNDQQINELVAWTSIAINLIAFAVLFLKGRWTVIILSVAATLLSPVAIYGTYWHHIITEPLRWWPFIAIFRLAKPSSRWADWFYNEPKMQLARERYPTANPVPRSLRKQAIRNLREFDRAAETGDWSAIKQRIDAETSRKQMNVVGDVRITTARKVKCILRWAVGIIVDLVALYSTHNALISTILAAVAFWLTKAVLSLWTTPADELYDAMRSGKPERIKAATAFYGAAEKGDKEGAKTAIDALAKAIREGK
jgi:hypothetical protein